VEENKLNSEKEALINTLRQDLMKHFGPVIGGDDLRQVLGYKTGAAFRLAIKQNDIALPVFTIKKRRGRFALAIDIATWLAEQKYSTIKEVLMKK
jgi:hypothetical protein